MFMLIAIGAVRLGIPGGYAIDCGESSPFARPKYSGHVVLVAKAVVIQGWPARLVDVQLLPFGVVQKHFWGLPWWDRKIVLLAGVVRNGETYFVDGSRMRGLLTQFLPVVEIGPCNRSRAVKYAAVDLRLLQDGPPNNGIRIIGQVTHRFNKGVSDEAPGIEVAITGPAGTTTVTSDQHGIYDLSGLPPGRYAIAANAETKRLGSNRCYLRADRDLEAGDVWGCSLLVD